VGALQKKGGGKKGLLTLIPFLSMRWLGEGGGGGKGGVFLNLSILDQRKQRNKWGGEDKN